MLNANDARRLILEYHEKFHPDIYTKVCTAVRDVVIPEIEERAIRGANSVFFGGITTKMRLL
jgi:hypothetical protein